jgi:vacuolar-type H+-ATPase subunit D/Vma8
LAGMAGSLDVENSMTASSSALAALDVDVSVLLRTDDDLAREINSEHGHVEMYKHNTIQHAIRCGELLLEMKQRVGHGNWLAWVHEHFEASERTARNYMEIAKSAAVADLKDDTTMRSALRALASRSRSKARTIPGVEVVQAPRAALGQAHQRTWASVPTRLGTIKRVFSEVAGGHLDDHSASEVLYRASREAHQAAADLEQLAAALKRRAATT